MPYCEGCARFYNPNTLTERGDCPEGHHVADPVEPEAVPPLPWHFKLMLVALIVYLGWRFFELIEWLV